MSFYIFSTFFVAVVLLCLTMIIYLGGKNYSSHACALWILGVAFWVSSGAFAFLFASLGYMDLAAFWVRGCYFWGTFIGITVFYFSLTYPNSYRPAPFVRTILFLAFLLIVALCYMKDIFSLLGYGDLIPLQTVIADTYFNTNGYLGWTFGSLYILWDFVFFGFWMATLATLWQKYTQQVDTVLRKQSQYMFWAITAGIVPGIVLNTLFPWLGIFGLFWPGLLASLGWVSILTYSLIKQNQMEVLVVTSELLVIVLILLMFIGFFAV